MYKSITAEIQQYLNIDKKFMIVPMLSLLQSLFEDSFNWKIGLVAKPTNKSPLPNLTRIIIPLVF